MNEAQVAIRTDGQSRMCGSRVAQYVFKVFGATVLLALLTAGIASATPSIVPPVRSVVVGLPNQTTPPLGFWAGKSPAGFSIDYLHDLADRLGLKLEFREFASFEQATDALCTGRVDLVPDLLTNAIRQRCMDFSSPYLRSPLVLVVPHGSATVTAADLPTRVFVAEQGYTTAQWLVQRVPPGHLRLFKDTRSALDALQAGEGDAYLGEPYQLDPLFSAGQYKSLEVRQQDLYENAALHFGISAKRPDLREALNAAMARTPSEFLTDLQLRWLDKRSIRQRMEPSHLGAAPRQWLDELPPLRVGYEEMFRPVSFLDERGQPSGLSFSYLEYLINALRLRVAEPPLKTNGPAPSEQLDLRIPVDFSSEHMPGWRYTQPFVKIPNVLVTRLGEPAKTSIEELNGTVLVVPADPDFASRLQQRVPDSKLIQVADPATGLEWVRTGKAGGYVGNLISVDRLLEKGWSDSLKIAAATDLPLELSIAVSERYAQLVPLLDQVIQSIPIEQRDLFAQQWLRNTYEIGVSPQRLWRIVGSVAAIASLIIAVLLYAHLSLKARQRALSEAEQRLSAQLRFSRELLESYPYPVAIKDRQRRYIMLNKAYEHTFGVKAAQVLGRSVDEVQYYPVAVRTRISQMVDAALHDDARQQAEHILLGDDGRDQNWLYIVTPYRLDSVEPQGVLTTFIDVTSIRAAERQASQLQRRLERITRNLPATVFEARLRGARDLRLTYVAGNVETLLQLSPTVLMDSPRSLRAKIFREDFPDLRRAISQSFQRRESCIVSFRLGDANHFRWIRMEAMPWQDADGSLALAGVLLDVTEAHAYENMLAETTRMAEQAAEAKAAFLATMSHEIRTPMNGILGLLELMGDLDLSGDALEMLSMVHDSTRSLLKVLNDTLDFSRIDSGMLDVAPEATDLRQLLDGALRLIGHQAHSKGLVVHSLVDHRIAGLLEVDGSRLRQVLLNLLSNAVKFTESGSVRLELAVIDSDEHSQRLEFLVADTGIGISHEQQTRLFQPFVQADSSITRRYGGSGLGLMISRQLVRLMDGELYLESRLNEGTHITFTLSLPVVAYLETPFSSHSVRLDPSVGAYEEALSEHLMALGFVPSSGQEDVLITANGTSTDGPPTLMITTEALPTGHTLNSTASQLSVNPLLWGDLHAALEVLIHGHRSITRRPLPRPGSLQWHRVLVVEDHPTNRLLLTRQLQHLQCAFTLVENGQEALERLDTEQFTLILTDCYMPQLDGYAMTLQARQSKPGAASIPIIGMTASIHPQEQQRARAAGMNELILKPIGLGALIELFERYLQPVPSLSATTTMGGLKAVMWQSFLDETNKDLPAIEAAVISADGSTLSDLLHKLMGGLHLVDLSELADQAQRIQSEVIEGSIDPAAIRAFLNRLREATN